MNVIDLPAHFRRALFNINMQATTKFEAIEELLDLFVMEKYVKDKHIVLEMLNQRETLGSTGLGRGVAIPHGRTTATADVVIAFGRTENKIEFDAIDKKPVNLFFMVIAPPNDERNVYLPVLGSLVTLLKNNKIRNQLQKIQSFEELMSVISGE